MEEILHPGAADRFPVGMRVLVVDDDPLCLMILKRMLQQCKYNVTTCNRAIEALQLLRERKTKFDLVMSDVYMPDIDGFKLLELIGLEMDLPVIMMSANGETSVVMKGITHGACDYLLKPVRLEELRNIWQHVVRKRVTKEVKEESSGEWDDSGEKTPDSASEQSSRKRKEKFEAGEEQMDSISGLKKPRVVWSGELHRLFVSAVNQLGVEKAVPKRILEIMNVQGLSRENVASHLQKYRLGLKRLSGVDPEPHPIASFQADEGGSFGGTMSIQPAASKSSGSKSGGGAPGGVFGKGLNQLDPGTLAALKQLQALQQANQARVLKGPRAVRMRQTALGRVALQRTCSVELGSLMQDHWTSSWQHQQQPAKPTTSQSAAAKAEVDMFSSSSSSNSLVADFQAIASLKDVRLDEREQGSETGGEHQGEELPTTTGELSTLTDLYFASSPSPYAFGQHVFTQQDSNWADY